MENYNDYLNYMILGIIIISFCILLLFIHSKYFSAFFYFAGYKVEGTVGFVKETKNSRKATFFENKDIKVGKNSYSSMIEILKNPLYYIVLRFLFELIAYFVFKLFIFIFLVMYLMI